MTRASLDTLQAKALDDNTATHEGRLFYTVGKDRYHQCTRNNERAPKTLKGNRRLSDTPGQWGVVASKEGALRAFDICFALEYVGAIPEHVGKILCLSCEHVLKEGDVQALSEASVTLVFDDVEGGIFPKLEEKPLVDSSLIGYRAGKKMLSIYNKIIWKGEVPDEYIEYAERGVFNDAYAIEINQIDTSLRKLGAKFWGMESKVKLVKTLSYGYFTAEGFEDLVSRPHYASYTNFPCEFEYDPDVENAKKKCHEKLAPMGAILKIWSTILRENCLLLDLEDFDANDQESVDKILNTGKMFGIDHAVKAYYDAGVPVDDILA